MPDKDRPLSPRGRREAAAMGTWLSAREQPDLVIASSALRTRQTAELVCAARGEGSPEPATEPALYQASEGEVVELARTVGPEVTTLQLVGHQPAIEDVTRLLLGEDPRHGFPPGTIVVLDVAGPWAALGPGGAALVAIAGPNDIVR